MSHYQTLGVAKTATPDEIKKSYRKLASQHHPDKGGDTTTFQKIEEAYRILSDPQQRQQYDNPQPQFQGPQFQGFGGDPNFNGVNLGDLFSQMFGHAGHPQHRQQQQPHVFRTVIHITLEQAFNGDTQNVRLQTPMGTHAINVSIPKGIQDGGQVRYEKIIDGASLMVEFRIQPHLKYDRKLNDLYANHSISVLDLIVGTTFEFTTLSGKTLEVRVPPKTQPFMQLKIAGQGMPINGTTQYGDQIILLKPFVPDIIDAEITESILRSKL
jgi:DnaJ-class molecular chaperone